MLKGSHVSTETQKKVVVDIELQLDRTKYSVSRILELWDINRSTFYAWKGEKSSEPRQRQNFYRILPHEEQAVINYRQVHRDVGYRKFTWMMNDAEIAALSESVVYGVLSKNNLLGPAPTPGTPAEKEYRHKPTTIHEHWHIDISYIKVKGVFYFFVMILDGYSRYILGWELMPDMLGSSVENFVQKVREKYPSCSPKLISDNGPQFISRDFKALVSRLEVQQVFTRRNHPQTNGKAERWNGTLKQEAIRVHVPASFDEARQVIGDFVTFYNNKRLHAGIKFVTPLDMFLGRQEHIVTHRKNKLALARSFRFETNKFINLQEESTLNSQNQFVQF
jgi:transposase InsO family protein